MDMRISLTPAEVYDRQFVPALFRHWGGVITGLAKIGTGMHVLDVACGTGALTGEVARRVATGGSVTGLDINPDMLAVARSKYADVAWREGRAERLPFDDLEFDAVVSQFGFMFFDDPESALREMQRVLRPGGRLCIAVCDAIDHSPGYAVLAELLDRLFGGAIAEAFRAPFASGDRQKLLDLCHRSGMTDATVTRHDGPVHFASIASLVAAERACAWTLGGMLDEDQFERLLIEAGESLQPFVTDSGEIALNMPVLVISSDKAA